MTEPKDDSKDSPDIVLTLIFFLVGLICFFIALEGPYFAWQGLDEFKRSQSWPSCEGEISNNHIDPEDGTTIEYRYKVGSTDYRSTRLDFRVIGLDDGQYLPRYPVGKKVTVYYDPDSPAEAVLTRETYGQWVIAIITPMFLGISWIFFTLFRRNLRPLSHYRLTETYGFFSLMPAAFLVGNVCALMGVWTRVATFVAWPLIFVLVPSLRRKYGAASGCGILPAAFLGLIAVQGLMPHSPPPKKLIPPPISCHGVTPGMGFQSAKSAAFDLTGPLEEGTLYEAPGRRIQIVVAGESIRGVSGGESGLLGRPVQEAFPEDDLKMIGTVFWAPVEGGHVVALCDQDKITLIRTPRLHAGKKAVLVRGAPINSNGWEQVSTGSVPSSDSSCVVSAGKHLLAVKVTQKNIVSLYLEGNDSRLAFPTILDGLQFQEPTSK